MISRTAGRRRALTAASVSATALLVLAGCAPGALSQGEPQPSQQQQPTSTETQQPEPTQEPASFKMSVMGDWLPHDSVIYDAETENGYDFAQFADPIRDVYDDSDLVYCNQEVPTAESFPHAYYPTFNSPPELASGMQEAGCNVIGLGNNHAFDYGQQGVDETRQVWDQLSPELIHGAARSPEEQRAVSFTEVNGVTVSFVNFVSFSNAGNSDYALAFVDNHELRASMMAEAAEADVTIVAMHWGDEYSHEVNAFQREYSQILIDEGADIIVGTHPHVVQPVEWMPKDDGTDALVFFSVGNFLSTQMEIPRLIGMLGQFDVTVEPDGRVLIDNAHTVPTYMHFDLSVYDNLNENWINRVNLNVYPLWDAAEPLARSGWRDQVSVESLYAMYDGWAGTDQVPVVHSADELDDYR